MEMDIWESVKGKQCSDWSRNEEKRLQTRIGRERKGWSRDGGVETEVNR